MYAGTKRKKKGCGECKGCCAQDCGVCMFCIDKPKFGGPGRKRQSCIETICTGHATCKLPSSKQASTILSNSTANMQVSETVSLSHTRIPSCVQSYHHICVGVCATKNPEDLPLQLQPPNSQLYGNYYRYFLVVMQASYLSSLILFVI